MTNPQSKDVQELQKMLKGIKFAMVTFARIDDTGLKSCPMTTQDIDPNGDLWFLIGKESSLAKAAFVNDSVCLAYSEPSDTRFISVQGRAEILVDRAKAKELWNPIYKAWFPEGLEDRNLAILKVSVTEAEYWDPKSGKFIQLIGFAKAMLTGKKFQGNPKDHGTIQFKH